MEIGPKPFIIAEMSGNHGGSLERAKELILAAHWAGCDAIKIQTYEPSDLGDPANNQIYEKCKIPRHWHRELFYVARRTDIPIFSSVFSLEAIEFLETLKCPAYKLASPESTRLSSGQYENLTLAIRDTKKTFVASSGMDDWWSIKRYRPQWMLYCKAGYPATLDDDDIAFMMKNADGFSDHTNNVRDTLTMIGAGARIIEKHFKLDDDCIDAAFSLNPTQMKLLCDIAHR